MKVSLNWLKNYLDIQLSPEKLGEVLTDIGLEVEGMEEVESIPGGLKGLVIGEVLTCERHPNADRLSLTTVRVGEEGPLLQIVCGAPNVAAGKKVVVATPGTELHPIEGEPFTIKKGKIRGEVSEGMICAEDEIGLGTSHDGVILLPDSAEVGQPAADYYGLQSDIVYEIGLTPNRSDATSHLGVAEDLAAALQINYGHEGVVKYPDLTDFRIDQPGEPVKVRVENTEACPRYSGLTITGLRIGESPDWLKNYLRAVDVRPINNVVDITNFVLHEYGQPLHAFDLHRIEGRTILVKTLPEGTKFISLDEQERVLSAEDIMICDGTSKGMCIGGVFGGISSGVTDQTTAIFLESAHFNAKWIRRTSMRHLLRTDAAKVFEKGSDPNITVKALKRAALLLKELAGGTIASDLVDIYPNPIEPVEVQVKYAYVNRLIGVSISPSEIETILAALSMKLVATDALTFTVAVPTNKPDVTRPADVVEEILRIYGFNKVPFQDQVRSSISYTAHPEPRRVQNTISDLLAAGGFNEMMALSLSESRYYKEVLPNVPESELVYVNNTSNIHLDIMRADLLFSGLEAVVRNQNRQQADLKLFEFGRSYRKQANGFAEAQHLTLFMTGKRWAENWKWEQRAEVDYYSLRGVVDQLFARLGVTNFQQSAVQDEVFAFGMKYHNGPKVLARFGMLQNKLLRKMEIRLPVLYADLQWDELLRAMKKNEIHFTELNKYPSMRRDLALVVDNSVKFSDIVEIARKKGKQLLKDINLFDVYANEDQLGKGKKSYAVSFSFEDPSKTLKDKEVDKVMNELIQVYELEVGALIRR